MCIILNFGTGLEAIKTERWKGLVSSETQGWFCCIELNSPVRTPVQSPEYRFCTSTPRPQLPANARPGLRSVNRHAHSISGFIQFQTFPEVLFHLSSSVTGSETYNHSLCQLRIDRFLVLHLVRWQRRRLLCSGILFGCYWWRRWWGVRYTEYSGRWGESQSTKSESERVCQQYL